jgi:membrane protease YdiL (CAAX protease family)
MKKRFKFLLKLLRLTVLPFVIDIGMTFAFVIVGVFIFIQSYFYAVLLTRIRSGMSETDMSYFPDMAEGSYMSYMEVFVLFIPVLTGLYFFFWYRRLIKKDIAPEPKVKLFTVKNILLIALAGLGLQLATSGLMELILPHFKVLSEEYEDLMEQLFTGNPVLVFISIVIVAPLSEELTFRGVIFKNARKITPFAVANIIQALLFGIAHFNLVQGIYAFGGGLAMGYIAYKFKSVKASIMLHFFYNGLSYILMAPKNEMSVIMFVIVGAVLILFSLILIRKVRPEMADVVY